ncbi:MAG: penicillin-insensitive murein endopeptidase [Myxococcales bacterium]|nr:penicillin-insensitive murein endopeptidase [Myxococcales bacterium]
MRSLSIWAGICALFVGGCGPGCGSQAGDRAEATVPPPAVAPKSAPPSIPAATPIEETPPAPALEPKRAPSTSIGSPSNGRLESGEALPPEGPGFLRNPKSPNAEAVYGTNEMIAGLVRAAAKVHGRHPGSRVVINDVGMPGGGPIYHHGSHQAGRDVDVLFFYRYAKTGEPFDSKGIPIEPDGTGDDYGDLTDPKDDVKVRFDAPRTWALMEALVTDPELDIQRIFIVEHVRTMLLDYATKSKAPAAAIERFSDVTCQPSTPHDDHFHMRIYCSAEDIAAGCEDAQPIYPWQRERLASLGLEPVIAKPRRGPKARAEVEARTVSQEEAVAEMGPMHPRVRAFLKRQETWSKQPHPGRRYCK